MKNGLKCSTKMAINPPKMIQMTPNLDQYCISMVSRHVLKSVSVSKARVNQDPVPGTEDNKHVFAYCLLLGSENLDL